LAAVYGVRFLSSLFGHSSPKVSKTHNFALGGRTTLHWVAELIAFST
jgi:hypothetical protein